MNYCGTFSGFSGVKNTLGKVHEQGKSTNRHKRNTTVWCTKNVKSKFATGLVTKKKSFLNRSGNMCSRKGCWTLSAWIVFCVACKLFRIKHVIDTLIIV